MAAEEHCLHCFDVLASHFTRGSIPPAAFALDAQYPLFVTWNKSGTHGGGTSLRGCIGAHEQPQHRTDRTQPPTFRVAPLVPAQAV